MGSAAENSTGRGYDPGLIRALNQLSEPDLESLATDYPNADEPSLITLDDFQQLPGSLLSSIEERAIVRAQFEGAAATWRPVAQYGDRLIVRQSASPANRSRVASGYMVLGGSLFLTSTLEACLSEDDLGSLPETAWGVGGAGMVAAGRWGGQDIPFIIAAGALVAGSHVYYRPARRYGEPLGRKFINASLRVPLETEIISICDDMQEVISFVVSTQTFMTPLLQAVHDRRGRSLLGSRATC